MVLDASTARKKLADFLAKIRSEAEPGAVLGGANLPETLVFEGVALAFPESRVVHLDGTTNLTEEQVLSEISRSFQPGHVLLVTLSFRSGFEVFKPLERLLSQGSLDVLGPTGWTQKRPPEGWRLVVHSRPGSFPYDEDIVLRLNLGSPEEMPV